MSKPLLKMLFQDINKNTMGNEFKKFIEMNNLFLSFIDTP